MKSRFLAAPYLIWMIIFVLVPLAVVVYFAFTDVNSGALTVHNIVRMGNYLPIFIKSIWLALISAAICLVVGYPVAYFIAKAPAKLQRILLMLIILPMCISFLLRTMAWVSLLEDTGVINNLLGAIGIGPLPLIRNNAAVVLGMVYNYLPYMILPLYTVLEKMDPRLIEAAQDLGGDDMSVFTKVTLPLSAPGIVSGITMVFVPAVSTFYISKKLGGTDAALIGDVIESQFKAAYNPNFGAALSLVLMILIFICIGLTNRVSGDEEGAMMI